MWELAGNVPSCTHRPKYHVWLFRKAIKRTRPSHFHMVTHETAPRLNLATHSGWAVGRNFNPATIESNHSMAKSELARHLAGSHWTRWRAIFLTVHAHTHANTVHTIFRNKNNITIFVPATFAGQREKNRIVAQNLIPPFWPGGIFSRFLLRRSEPVSAHGTRRRTHNTPPRRSVSLPVVSCLAPEEWWICARALDKTAPPHRRLLHTAAGGASFSLRNQPVIWRSKISSSSHLSSLNHIKLFFSWYFHFLPSRHSPKQVTM